MSRLQTDASKGTADQTPSGQPASDPPPRDSSRVRDVRELKGMFGPATKTVTIEEMNRVIQERGASTR